MKIQENGFQLNFGDEEIIEVQKEEEVKVAKPEVREEKKQNQPKEKQSKKEKKK